MADSDSDTRTLEVRTQHEGIFRIEVPSGWRITFSKVNPQSNGFENALRIYEGEEKQRACFTGVVSFRDLSIPFQRRVKRTQEQMKAKRGPNGSKVEREASHEYAWVEDADEFGAF
jgi:hypothetical protein